MTTYNISYYMSYHNKIVGIEADSMEEAIAKGLDEAWSDAHAASNKNMEFAEECTGALVDVQGDYNYDHSKYFTQQEVYDAKPYNEHDKHIPEGRD